MVPNSLSCQSMGPRFDPAPRRAVSLVVALGCQYMGPGFDPSHRAGYTTACVGELFHPVP